MKKNVFFALILLLLTLSTEAQTSISGIINTYEKVDSIYTIGSNSYIRTASPASFDVNDKVLIIQMKGAQIDTTESAAFGNITAIGSAGNYEFSRILQISGTTVVLCDVLVRTYDPAFYVQLIRVPEYTSAVIDSTLYAKAWDGITGGVLAFDVMNTLTFNANIDVVGRGFQAGQSNYYGGVNCHQTGYAYSNTSLDGVDKGEGICVTSNNLKRGRGCVANGGGGGNNHNAGGAGGSNGGYGGNGGKEWAGCGSPLANGGLGGIALPYSNIMNKVFMGGGGGAGHHNITGANSPGANGSGIVLINAGTIIGNNYNIKAEGANVLPIIFTYDEGRGGGGAGGAVLLNANTYSTILQINVSGGDGGYLTTYGASPGGGGGGGVVWVSQGALDPALYTNIAGGNAGTTGSTSDPNYGSSAGNIGMVMEDLVMPASVCGGFTTGLQNQEARGISVYPNPTTGHLRIIGAPDSTIIIYNSLGMVVLTAVLTRETTELNISKLPKGIYFCKIGTVIKKIVKE